MKFISLPCEMIYYIFRLCDPNSQIYISSLNNYFVNVFKIFRKKLNDKVLKTQRYIIDTSEVNSNSSYRINKFYYNLAFYDEHFMDTKKIFDFFCLNNAIFDNKHDIYFNEYKYGYSLFVNNEIIKIPTRIKIAHAKIFVHDVHKDSKIFIIVPINSSWKYYKDILYDINSNIIDTNKYFDNFFKFLERKSKFIVNINFSRHNLFALNELNTKLGKNSLNWSCDFEAINIEFLIPMSACMRAELEYCKSIDDVCFNFYLVKAKII